MKNEKCERLCHTKPDPQATTTATNGRSSAPRTGFDFAQLSEHLHPERGGNDRDVASTNDATNNNATRINTLKHRQTKQNVASNCIAIDCRRPDPPVKKHDGEHVCMYAFHTGNVLRPRHKSNRRLLLLMIQYCIRHIQCGMFLFMYTCI